MHNETFEQYDLNQEVVDEAWKYLKESMVCSILLFNNNPIGVTPPNHVVLRVEYCEPGVRGNTATNVTKPAKVETGAEMIVPNFEDPYNPNTGEVYSTTAYQYSLPSIGLKVEF